MDGEGPGPSYSKGSTGRQHCVIRTFVRAASQSRWTTLCTCKPHSSTFSLGLVGHLPQWGLGSESPSPQEAQGS